MNPLQTASLIISPSLNFSISFALSSFLNDEIISLLETQAFPNWRLPPSLKGWGGAPSLKGWGGAAHAIYPIL